MQPPSVSEVIRTFSAMPGLQLVFFALAAVTWLGGGNILVAYHYKRVGKSAWSAFSSTLTGSSRTLIRGIDESRPGSVSSLYIRRNGMETRIQKWGNSLGLRIPRSFAAEAQVEEGSAVDLSVENGRLLVRPLRTRKYALSALLKKVKPQNLHDEVATGKRVGRETW